MSAFIYGKYAIHGTPSQGLLAVHTHSASFVIPRIFIDLDWECIGNACPMNYSHYERLNLNGIELSYLLVDSKFENSNYKQL